jgi:uncharacterized protein DUF4340
LVAPRVKLWGWATAAALAAGFLGALAFHGERPEPGLGRFEPAGLLLGWPIEDISALELSTGTEHHSFYRGAGRWRTERADVPLDLDERIATGLKLLHNSAPERVLAESEVGEKLGEFGLEPPRLTLAARTAAGRSVTIRFGGTNPLGLARYTRIEGQREVILLPAFVAQAWERVMEPR